MSGARILAWLAWSTAFLGHPAWSDDLARQVVIVYNANDPASRPLADYYAERRGVPTNQICEIRVRPAETITRKEFNDQVREPILSFLTNHGLLRQDLGRLPDREFGSVPTVETRESRISYLALIYGVPLRIERDPTLTEMTTPTNAPPEFRRNEAAVDSELALLPSAGVPVTGPARNPFYNSSADQFGPPMNRHMLLVGRLDGPKPADVRRLIDDALIAERYGLQGRVYIDARGIQTGGYVAGDTWLRGAYHAFQQAGFECELDDQEPVFPADYPLSDVAVYAGWYAANLTGPFAKEDFHFKTGAVACHIHSFSAPTLRTAVAGWVGPLVAKGAAAVTGNVYEPYLSLTPHLDMFFRKLLDGATFLEAGYYSLPALSWQTTFVGDPLYRPFGVSLEDQIARLAQGQKPDIVWAYLRKINLLARRGLLSDAEVLCRARARALSSVVLYEKLGDLLHARQQDPDAREAYRQVLAANPRESGRYVRVARKLAAAGDASVAEKLENPGLPPK